jgi:hypothetical protein
MLLFQRLRLWQGFKHNFSSVKPGGKFRQTPLQMYDKGWKKEGKGDKSRLFCCRCLQNHA